MDIKSGLETRKQLVKYDDKNDHCIVVKLRQSYVCCMQVSLSLVVCNLFQIGPWSAQIKTMQRPEAAPLIKLQSISMYGAGYSAKVQCQGNTSHYQGKAGYPTSSIVYAW